MKTEAQFSHGAKAQWRISVEHRWVSLVVEDDAGNSAEITLFCDAPDKRAHMDALLAAAAKGLADLAIAEAQKKAEDTTGDAEAVTEAAVASETPTGITNADDEEEPF